MDPYQPPPGQSPFGPSQGPQNPPAKKSSTLLIILAVVVPMACCVPGILAAIAIPAFTRYIKRSKAQEARVNTPMICHQVVAVAAAVGTLPPSAPRTPAQPPPGRREFDPPGTWDTGPWAALRFRISPPHYYAYEYVNEGERFSVRALGDLDGDGLYSTFEMTGDRQPDGTFACGPLQITNELE